MYVVSFRTRSIRWILYRSTLGTRIFPLITVLGNLGNTFHEFTIHAPTPYTSTENFPCHWFAN